LRLPFPAVPALKKDFELVQLGDPRTELHQERLEQTLKETEQWLAGARLALKEQKLSLDESRVLLKFYENGLEGYTYLE